MGHFAIDGQAADSSQRGTSNDLSVRVSYTFTIIQPFDSAYTIQSCCIGPKGRHRRRCPILYLVRIASLCKIYRQLCYQHRPRFVTGHARISRHSFGDEFVFKPRLHYGPPISNDMLPALITVYNIPVADLQHYTFGMRTVTMRSREWHGAISVRSRYTCPFGNTVDGRFGKTRCSISISTRNQTYCFEVETI